MKQSWHSYANIVSSNKICTARALLLTWQFEANIKQLDFQC